MHKKIRIPFAAILLLIINVYQLIDIGSKIVRFGRVYDVFSVITLAIELALCGILFAKKRNNALVIVLGCQVLMKLVDLVRHGRYFSVVVLFDLLVYASLTVFALAACEQTIVKTDLSKVKEIGNKLFYIPAVVYSALHVYVLISNIANSASIVVIVSSAVTLLYGLVLLNLGKWLKDPYVKEKPVRAVAENGATEEEQGEAYCGLGKHIVLLLFTCGIWYLIWTHRTTKYLNKTPNAEYYNPTSKLLLCMFVPFYSIYWFYKHGQRIDSFTKSKGLNHSDMATLCLILGIFIPLVACIIMQEKINTLCTSKNINTMTQEQPQTADELKKYKELLDSGVITQEEFDAKKKQLLDL